MASHRTSYLSSKIEGRQSMVNDRGIFALEPIQPGERLLVWGGEIRTLAALQALPPELRRLSIQVDEGLYLVSTCSDDPADWVNHSCDPNAGLQGQITLVALREIAPGEEICFDYAMSDGSPYDQFECRCGAANCRGRVSGEDWRDPALQARYQGYFSAYLQRRMAKQGGNTVG